MACFLGTLVFSGVTPLDALRNANTARVAWATRGRRTGGVLAVLTCAALTLQTGALAQNSATDPAVEEIRRVPSLTADLLRAPEPKLMMSGLAALRRWIDGWEVVPNDETAALGNASGAICLTLRYGGRIIGRSVEIGGPESLARAARSAMKDAAAFFGEKGKPANAARIAISLEAAGALVPYRVSTYDDADLEIPAGIDGVGARAGEGPGQRLRLVFPSMMLTFGHGADRTVGSGGQSPGDALSACAAFVLEDPAVGLRSNESGDPARLQKERGVTFYRFEVSHLAQVSPVESPVFMYRQGRVFQERDVTSAAMKSWAQGLATHLVGRVSVHENGALVSGLYSPVSGACVVRAEIGEQALIGLALARCADSGLLDSETSSRARDAARAIVRDLANRRDEKRKVEGSPVSAAAFLLTIHALAIDAPEATEAVSAARRVLRDLLSGPVRAPSVHALGAWAAAGDEELRSLAPGAVNAVYRAAPVEKLSTAMPWIVFAVRALEPGGEIASAPVLDQWRDLVFRFVMQPQDAGSDGEDLVGGIVLTGSRAPLPSAQSVRVFAGLAAMLNDERLTPAGDRAKEIARLVPSLRFLRQLMADEYSGTMYADPLRAEWGVRNSLWDQRMSGEASAIALLTLCEAVEGVGRSAK